jgi:uncharacterized protein YaiL (DUF2058 family)
MLIEKIEIDSSDREHLIIYDFTVRDNRYNCLTVNLNLYINKIHASNIILKTNFQANNIDWYGDYNTKYQQIYDTIPKEIKFEIINKLNNIC